MRVLDSVCIVPAWGFLEDGVRGADLPKFSGVLPFISYPGFPVPLCM